MSGALPCGCPLCGSGNSGGANVAENELWRRCTACDAMVFRRVDGPLVLVAHESEVMSQHIGAVLLAEGLSPVRVANGTEAWFVMGELRPAAVVVDVGLVQLSAFELIDRVREAPELRETKVVLIASVFNWTAYKRKPTSLYGADDYVEQHHIPDMLPAKLGVLLGRDCGAGSPFVGEVVARIEAAQARRELRGSARVRALAQAIVADIALYHEEELEETRRSGSRRLLLEPLAEGRRILAELAHDEAYPSPDPIEDAFALLIERERTEPR